MIWYNASRMPWPWFRLREWELSACHNLNQLELVSRPKEGRGVLASKEGLGIVFNEHGLTLETKCDQQFRHRGGGRTRLGLAVDDHFHHKPEATCVKASTA